MIERHFRMMLATFVISLAAMIGRSAMALCRGLVFLRRGGVRANYMGVFVNGMLLICVPDRCLRSMRMIVVQHSLQHVDSRLGATSRPDARCLRLTGQRRAGATSCHPRSPSPCRPPLRNP